MGMIREKYDAGQWARMAKGLEALREDLEELHQEILADGLV
jgi:hypothetical protein